MAFQCSTSLCMLTGLNQPWLMFQPSSTTIVPAEIHHGTAVQVPKDAARYFRKSSDWEAQISAASLVRCVADLVVSIVMGIP